MTLPSRRRATDSLLKRAPIIVLIGLFASLPSCSKPSPEKVAQLMVDAGRNKGGSALDNLNNTPPAILAAALKEWSAALAQVLGEEPNVLMTLQIVTTTGELYVDGKFQPSESSKYAARLKSISKKRLNDWRLTVDRFEGGVDSLNVAWFMVRQSKMFDGSNLREDIANRQLARMQGLPRDVVSRWAAATEVDKGAVVFGLIQVDSLFQNTEFQSSVFEAALPHTKPLLQKLKK